MHQNLFFVNVKLPVTDKPLVAAYYKHPKTYQYTATISVTSVFRKPCLLVYKKQTFFLRTATFGVSLLAVTTPSSLPSGMPTAGYWTYTPDLVNSKVLLLFWLRELAQHACRHLSRASPMISAICWSQGAPSARAFLLHCRASSQVVDNKQWGMAQPKQRRWFFRRRLRLFVERAIRGAAKETGGLGRHAIMKSTTSTIHGHKIMIAVSLFRSVFDKLHRSLSNWNSELGQDHLNIIYYTRLASS